MNQDDNTQLSECGQKMSAINNRFAVTPTEAAKLLGISRYLVLKLIHTGELKHKKFFKRYLLQVDDLQEWLRESK